MVTSCSRILSRSTQGIGYCLALLLFVSCSGSGDDNQAFEDEDAPAATGGTQVSGVNLRCQAYSETASGSSVDVGCAYYSNEFPVKIPDERVEVLSLAVGLEDGSQVLPSYSAADSASEHSFYFNLTTEQFSQVDQVNSEAQIDDQVFALQSEILGPFIAAQLSLTVQGAEVDPQGGDCFDIGPRGIKHRLLRELKFNLAEPEPGYELAPATIVDVAFPGYPGKKDEGLSVSVDASDIVFLGVDETNACELDLDDPEAANALKQSCSLALGFTPVVLETYQQDIVVSYVNGVRLREASLCVRGRGQLRAEVVLGREDFGTELISPTASLNSLSQPRGLAVTDERLYIVDSAFSRVKVINESPLTLSASSDVSIWGQESSTNSGAGLSETRVSIPRGISVSSIEVPYRVTLADTINNRIIGWEAAWHLPEQNEIYLKDASFVLGQANKTSGVDDTSVKRMRSPRSVSEGASKIAVADTSNNRILLFESQYANDMDASIVIGQPDFDSSQENQGGAVAATTMKNPEAVFLYEQTLFVADSGNNRILIFSDINSLAPSPAPADHVLGQEDFTSDTSGAGALKLNNPTSVYFANDTLVVTDQGNNRVLVWRNFSSRNLATELGKTPDFVFGHGDQDFDASLAPSFDSEPKPHRLRSPYAVILYQDYLFVSDRVNHRVLGRIRLPD